MFGIQNYRIVKNTNALLIVIFAIAAPGLAYCVCVNFLGFLYFSNTEKLLVISSFSFFLFSLFLLIPKSLILQTTKVVVGFSSKQKTILIMVAVGLAIAAFFAHLPSIPTINNFELSILPADSENPSETRLEILQIDRLGKDNQILNQISPYDFSLGGDWLIEKKTLSITSAGGDSFQYKDFSNYGISLLFLKSPDSGKVQVNWNGKSQIINLKSDNYEQVILDFPHGFSFYQMSLLRIFQIVLLLVSNVISIFLSIFLFLSIYSKIKELHGYFDNLRLYQRAILLFLIVTPLLNIYALSKYQSTDVFNLRRSSSNTLIDLDNSNEDNFPYFQVYYKLSQYFSGYDLIVPREVFTGGKVLSFARLKEERLLEYGRLNSVVEEDYSSELSTTQLEKTKEMKREFSPPIGRIPNEFIFLTDPIIQNNVICLWWSNETVFFIPMQDDFDCLKAKK